MAATYEPIATTTLGSNAASYTFSSIPGTYTDLKILLSARNTAVENAVFVSFNGTTTTYSGKILFGNGASAASNNPAARTIAFSTFSTDTASTFANAEIYIPNYAGSNQKSFSSDTAQENNAATSYQIFLAGLWTTTSAITQVTLSGASGSFAQYSSASLYGIKNS
jgi:hypothetical protein